jgi:anti-sigma regulatory factor (Ser/Thr protein kinase)
VGGNGDAVASDNGTFADDLGPPPDTGVRLRSVTGGFGLSPAASGERKMEGRRRAFRLHAVEGSVTPLRRELSEFLRGATLSVDERHDLLLAACKAASNAVEHARDPSEPFVEVLAAIADAGVRIVVSDHGQWRHTAPGAHRGQGPAMMGALAHPTISPGPQRTSVTIRSSPGHGRHPVFPAHDGAAANVGPGSYPGPGGR